MERFAWTAQLLPGRLDEYIRRHDEIWPEMSTVLEEAGIRNYTASGQTARCCLAIMSATRWHGPPPSRRPARWSAAGTNT